MQVELQIDGGKYPVEIDFIVSASGEVIYKSEYLGSTISTFPSHKSFQGRSMEESLNLIGSALRKAIQELLEQ